MPISEHEFEEGIKPLEKSSLEYKILEFLKKEKLAYMYKEILEAFNVIAEVDCLEAILNLLADKEIRAKAVKTQGKSNYTLYIMAK